MSQLMDAKVDELLDAPAAKGSLFMRPFALGATAYLATLNALFVITRGRIQSPDRWADVYLVILAVYAGATEVKRWMSRTDESGSAAWDEQIRKGGPLITLWVLLLFGAGLWRVADPSRPMPPEIKEITLKVIGLFFGTYAFRQYRRRAQGGQGLAHENEDSTRPRILALLTEKGPLNAATLAESLAVNRRTVLRLLKSMVESGEVHRQARTPTDPNAAYQATSSMEPKART